ncbi:MULTISPECIES: hypothetical protein [Sphingobium]|nr:MULTISPECIES: hypothetical protein [Sphingobium]
MSAVIKAMIRRFGLFCLALGAMTPSVAHARWMEARSDNFIVTSDGNEADLRESATLLENYDQLLRSLTGTSAPPSPARLKVYMVSSAGKLRQVARLPDGARGVYMARVGGTAALAVRGDRPGLGGEEVLLHEYTHHFMTRYYPAAYPAWYSEGFAEYVMTARFLADRIEIGRPNPGRAASLLNGTWLPVERIFASGRRGLSAAQLPQFYAESWLIVHYLFAALERREALIRYLADLHRGIAEPAAFRSAFGKDHAAFEIDLKRYRDGGLGFGSMGRHQGPSPAITVSALPASADDLLLHQLALNLGMADPALEAETLAAIRTVAARYPDDPYAQRVRARVEIGSGDRAAGVAMIDKLIAQMPSDAELLYYRGIADFFTGRRDEARRPELYAAAHGWFAKAVEADPGYYTALYRLALTAPDTSAGRTDKVVGQLLVAHRLAPLVGDIAIGAATALVARRRYAEATAAIMPIAANPHGANVQRAQALLDRIQVEATDRQ